MTQDHSSYQLNFKQLIKAYNREVGVNAWTCTKAIYLRAMRKEFQKPGFDGSLIITEYAVLFYKEGNAHNSKIKFTDYGKM